MKIVRAALLCGFLLSGYLNAALLTEKGFEEGIVLENEFSNKNKIVDFQLEGNRIGVLLDNGVFKVKEGGLEGKWSFEVLDVAQFELKGNQVAILTHDGVFRIKKGHLDANWQPNVETNVKSFRLTDSHVTYVANDGRFFVKKMNEGPNTLGKSEDDTIYVLTGADISNLELAEYQVSICYQNSKRERNSVVERSLIIVEGTSVQDVINNSRVVNSISHHNTIFKVQHKACKAVRV